MDLHNNDFNEDESFMNLDLDLSHLRIDDEEVNNTESDAVGVDLKELDSSFETDKAEGEKDIDSDCNEHGSPFDLFDQYDGAQSIRNKYRTSTPLSFFPNVSGFGSELDSSLDGYQSNTCDEASTMYTDKTPKLDDSLEACLRRKANKYDVNADTDVDVYSFRDDDSENEKSLPVSDDTIPLHQHGQDSSDASDSDHADDIGLLNASSCSACQDQDHLFQPKFDVTEHIHFSVKSTVSTKDTTPVNTMAMKRSKKLHQKVDTLQIRQAMRGMRRCCSLNCYRTHTVDKRLFKHSRKLYWSKEKNARKQWMLNKISQGNKENGAFYLFDDMGRKLCQSAFMNIFGICKTVYYRRRASVHNNERFVVIPSNRRLSPTSSRAVVWLENFAKHHGDVMPHMNQTRLPHGVTKSYVYKEYMEESVRDLKPFLGKSQFNELWRTYFPSLKEMKRGDNFSRCTVCTSIARQLAKEDDLTKRAALVQLRKDHNDRQMEERLVYYAKRDLARKHPRKYLSLIVDGMDQNKTNLPHMLGRTAKVMGNDRLKTHVTGVIAHGPDDQQFTFVDKGEFPHDSNMTINIILKIIWHLSKKGQRSLPPVLFLQADNCWRENKNKFVMAFLEVLVHLGVFKEIQLSFLMVGHTHDDIDQLFSQIAELLNQREAEILPELLRMLPNVEELYGLYDIKTWMAPHLSNIKGHSKPHHFRFVHDPHSVGPTHVNVQFKGAAKDPWRNLGGSMWKPSGSRYFNLRCRAPQVIQPDLEALNMKYLQSKFDRWACVFSDQKDNSQVTWWKAYANLIIRTQESSRMTKQYANRNAVWVLPKLPQCDVSDLNNESGTPVIGDALQKLIDEELKQPHVTIR